jgi:hypothetical protein
MSASITNPFSGINEEGNLPTSGSQMNFKLNSATTASKIQSSGCA